MNIVEKKEGNAIILEVEGRVDTVASPQLESAVKGIPEDVRELIIDLEKTEYVSSAGLRVLLGAQKKMNSSNGSLIVRHVNDIVMEIFEVTGFIDFLTIE